MVNALTLWVPTVLILVGILLNRSDYHSLRSEMKDMRRELEGKIDGKIDGLRSNLEGKIDGLRGDLAAVKDTQHADALEIMRQMTALHERVAVVEARQAS